MEKVYIVHKQNPEEWIEQTFVEGVFSTTEKAKAFIKEDAKWTHCSEELYYITTWKVH